MSGTKRKKSGVRVDLTGVLGGLGDLITSLGDLAQKGEALKKSGELDLSSLGDQLKGVYGVSIKTAGLGGDKSVTVEPFGNIRQGAGGTATIDDVHEPIVDVFEEEDHVQVIAELPGIEEKDVALELHEETLTIHAERPNKKYHKEVVLPWKANPDKIQKACRNGVLEVRIDK